MALEQGLSRPPGGPVRVMHLIDSLGRGGAERQMVGLLRRMNSARVISSVYHLYPNRELAGELESAGVSVQSLQFRNRLQGLLGLPRLARLIREEAPDVLHTWLYDADILGRVAGRLAGAGCMVTYLQNSFWEPEVFRLSGMPSWKGAILCGADRWTAHLSGTDFVACSAFVGRVMARALGVRMEGMRVLYNAVDPEEFAPEPPEALADLRQELELVGCSPILICVSRLIGPKGHELLLEAMPRILREYPAARLLLPGRGPDEARLKARAAALNLDGRVHFLGHRSDVRRLLQVSDIFAFPSLCGEGLPLALIEALAAGLPAVAWNVEPNPEVIVPGQSGFLAPRPDVDAFAAAVCELARDPDLRRRMGAAGRATVQQKFNIECIASQLEQYYLDRTRSGQGAAGRASVVGRQEAVR